jgi:hypothetical protein
MYCYAMGLTLPRVVDPKSSVFLVPQGNPPQLLGRPDQIEDVVVSSEIFKPVRRKKSKQWFRYGLPLAVCFGKVNEVQYES